MGFGVASCSLLLCVLLVLQHTYGTGAREITGGHWNNGENKKYDLHQAGSDHLKIFTRRDGGDDHNGIRVNHGDQHQMDHMDPALNVFFNINDLYLGKTMPIYFAIKDPSTSPHLIPREEADSIPFSQSQLTHLLKLFSFSEGSPQAKAMEETLRQCEFESTKGETKFCATSLESMLDSVREILGFETHFKVLTTITHFTKPTTLLQNYTILEVPRDISVPKAVACHTMPYPYAVFYCHCQESQNKLFMISLGGENGDRVDALAICHMDTTQWDRDHAAFRVLGTQPGSAPICHVFPPDNLVWVPVA
ncbi:hypothetical protein RJ639_047415 [Escallonia herrerae]|uniref:BURP domain-containing protein n=1 Tax=Escallonia herrerae TaxID=1293975 RepID=A0AA88WGL4_9ASTE|nr:hypothetical protein RJ639_047415 [Escallonia herrerae]